MIILKEIKKGNKSIFQRIHIENNGKVIFNDSIYFRLYKINEDGFDILVLYDDNMKVISPAYKFININMADLSFNSRENYMYAIRFFYCFLSLTKTKITELNKSDIEKLKCFLLGFSPSKGTYSMQLQTIRSNATVNGYLDVYRSYLKDIDIDCDYLFETEEVTLLGINPISENVKKVTSYKSNLKAGVPVKRVPRYISVNDFSRIITIIRDDNNLQAECIVRLMYQFGLRLGETLGLAFEDLTEVTINDKLYPTLYIRNRLSDKHFQKAKTCMNVTNKKQYNGKDYITENFGYQKVMITYDIYELLNNYIDTFHAHARENNLNRYTRRVTADKTSKDNYSGDNYYIFINSIGTVLSDQSWNNYIKSVFTRAGITIDKDSKKTNLNHRFRHGFAMFHIQYIKTPLLELKNLMRHASISSTMVYYNPTEEDEATIKNEFVNELYDLIPQLRE